MSHMVHIVGAQQQRMKCNRVQHVCLLFSSSLSINEPALAHPPMIHLWMGWARAVFCSLRLLGHYSWTWGDGSDDAVDQQNRLITDWCFYKPFIGFLHTFWSTDRHVYHCLFSAKFEMFCVIKAQSARGHSRDLWSAWISIADEFQLQIPSACHVFFDLVGEAKVGLKQPLICYVILRP